MNVFIIDDDELSKLNLMKLLELFCPDLCILGSAGSYQEAIAYLQPTLHQVDILFCDINLGSKTGFDLLDQLRDYRGFVVFVTAYEEFALKAYKYAPVNYLTKPVSPGALTRTIGRIKSRTTDTAQAHEAPAPFDTIPVYVAGKWEIINTELIICIQAQGSYSNLTVNYQPKPYTTTRPLRYYEEKLRQNKNFVRVQKSYIINKKHILSVSRNDNTIEMTGGISVPVGGGEYRTIIKTLIQ